MLTRQASVAVIGAGIFGVCAALELAELGADVTLYEWRQNILAGATSRNFFRLHRGYHYPRDLATARQARDGYESFTARFADAVNPVPVRHYYAIAAEGSLTTAEQFAARCDELRLRRRPLMPDWLVPGSVEACFEVREAYYDAGILQRLCHEQLTAARVRVELGYTEAAVIGQVHDLIVVTAYAAQNHVLTALGCPTRELQYETCEVPIIHAPGLPPLSLVVMDGPFVSVAPSGFGLHTLYDVEHSVHARYTGHGDTVMLPQGSQFRPMLETARRFIRGLDKVGHAGSMYATRVVLPGKDATDARPTELTWVTPRVLTVLSGKVCTAVDTGRLVAADVAARLALPVPA